MLESLGHIALVVREPARTAALFHELFSARVIERKDDEGHRETFVRLGGHWLVNHVFELDTEDLDKELGG